MFWCVTCVWCPAQVVGARSDACLLWPSHWWHGPRVALSVSISDNVSHSNLSCTISDISVNHTTPYTTFSYIIPDIDFNHTAPEVNFSQATDINFSHITVGVNSHHITPEIRFSHITPDININHTTLDVRFSHNSCHQFQSYYSWRVWVLPTICIISSAPYQLPCALCV